MEYCENWEQIRKKFLEYWAMENHDRPLVSIRAPKDRQEIKPESRHSSLKERWMDTEYVLKSSNWEMRNTYYGGEAFPSLNPNLGPDYFAACFGTKLEFGEDTSWSVPFLTDEDVEEYQGFMLCRQNEYYKKMLEITQAAVEDGKGKYLVGVTDIHPGLDGLVSMRGPQELCMDTLDQPEFIQKGAMDLLPGFREIYEELYTMTTKYQEGSTCWMGIWHPGRWYPTCCDFSCMIYTQMYEELVVGELLEELDFLDASIYHLDGPDALKHLDRLLAIDKLKGIQWVYGAGQPTASHWIPVLKKIQDAGKMIQIDVVPEELDIMLENLKPEGVMYTMNARTEEEGRALMKKVERYKR